MIENGYHLNLLTVYMGGFILSTALYINYIYSLVTNLSDPRKQLFDSFSPETKRDLEEFSSDENVVIFVSFIAALILSIIWPIMLPLLLLEMTAS